MKLVYLCHSYSGGPKSVGENKYRAAAFAKAFMATGDIVIAPQLFLDQCFDEATEREDAMRECLKLLSRCDRMYVCGEFITGGMLREITEAQKLGIKIVTFGRPIIWSPEGDEANKPPIEDDP